MEPWLYALLSSPICLTATFFNIIFFFCLLRPVAGVMLRNPLRILLIVVLFNTTFQQLVTALTIIMLLFDSPFWLEPLTRALIYQFFCANFSCNAWISIFYYISIVPQQHPIFIWIKRNINAILYVSLVLNQIVLLISLSIGTAVYFLVGSVPNNFTSLELNKTSPADQDLFKVSNFTYLLYCACSLFTLLFSWGKIFVYLCEHLKKIGQCSESFSLPKQKSHMRVTVTGMVQTAIFLPSSLWTIAVAFIYFKMADPNKFITMTFCSMSSLGNLMCFGYSQSVFRHGIVSVFNKLKRDK
ncbi:taste receptor type 2 member 60-like [Carassius carassius]|uniref:taste receptor type 2 member 60-like n=1 Tax=Carassius carassius TaxID=217509 RepID=UPI0028684361|nr:taste receptor type 2 member 60-like [Carassius carassius]